MAQYIPGSSVTLSASLRALEKAQANDDTDINTRLPSICVDYLSHDWEEEDVWTSWRNMTRHKNEIANGTRLENASWRTWWKQRNNLKTVSPETLNWLKDSDVTWLYGPLHTAADPIPPPKQSTTEERYNLEPNPLKGTKQRPNPVMKPRPILKHRTLSELLTNRTPSGLHLAADHADDADGHSNDESDLSGSLRLHKTISASTSSPSSTSSKSLAGTTPANADPRKGTSVHFNTYVQQCEQYPPESTSPSPRMGTPSFAESMGIHGIDIDMIPEDEYDELWAQWATADESELPKMFNGKGYAREEDDDEGGEGVIMMKTKRMREAAAAAPAVAAVPRPPTPPANSNQHRPEPRRTDSGASNHSANGVATIKKIAPTILKTSGIFPSPSPQVVFAPPPGAQLELARIGVSDLITTGPLSPGYVSEGYELLPIQLRDSAASAVITTGPKPWSGKSAWQRRAVPTGPQTAYFDEDDSSGSSDSAPAYESAYAPTVAHGHPRLATPVMGELEEEDEDAGVGIDYFSARTPTPAASAHHPYATATTAAGRQAQAEYEAATTPTSAVSVHRHQLPRAGGSAPSSPGGAGRRHHHYVGEPGAASPGAAVVNGRGRTAGATGVLPQQSQSEPSTPSGTVQPSLPPEVPSSPRASRTNGNGILKHRHSSPSSHSPSTHHHHSHGHHTRRASSPEEPARGRSSTRSPPYSVEERERGSAAPSVVAPQPAVSSPRTRRISAAKRASVVVPSIDTSPQSVVRPSSGPTTPGASGIGSGKMWSASSPDGVSGSGSGSHGFPSPIDLPPPPPAAALGVSLQRSTSSSNVRAGLGQAVGPVVGVGQQGVDGDGLVGKAVGMVRAFWGGEGGR